MADNVAAVVLASLWLLVVLVLESRHWRAAGREPQREAGEAIGE